jgi:hypothetical protein
VARRWIGWVLAGGLVAFVAFAPFRDSGGAVDTQGRLAPAVTGEDGGGVGAGDGALGPASPGAGGTSGSGASRTGGSGSAGGSTAGTTGGGSTGGGSSPSPEVPELPEPTEAELAVLGPLIAAMDTGQRAGTPLVLGIATSIVGLSLPSEDSVPPELQPVLSAMAGLLAQPGAQVNDLTTQNSVYLAQLDRALGELAFANPALNATIHETAALLAAMGRAAEPVSPPGAVSLGDLAVLLTYFVVE